MRSAPPPLPALVSSPYTHETPPEDQRLADACYLGGKSGDGEREQDWCQESFLYYERLLCSRQDGNRRKNLLRAAELALQFDMQEKTEQYLNEAAEIPGMEEDIFYQQIRKRWEEAG